MKNYNIGQNFTFYFKVKVSLVLMFFKIYFYELIIIHNVVLLMQGRVIKQHVWKIKLCDRIS